MSKSDQQAVLTDRVREIHAPLIHNELLEVERHDAFLVLGDPAKALGKKVESCK
jgi:hypothetical protein